MIFRYTISDTTPAAASTVAGDVINGLGDCDALDIVASLVGATGGVLDVYLQTSPDSGTTWFDWGHYTQLAAGAAAIIYRTHHGIATASTTTPLVVTGGGLTPALAANTFIGDFWGDRLRAVYKAGASTSAGAAVTINITGHKSRH